VTETFRGDQVKATLTDDTLTLHGTTRPSRIALDGRHWPPLDPVLSRAGITGEWRPATRFAPGRLTLHHERRTYVLHVRRDQQDDMARLSGLLGITVQPS
jgi:hypothetical protein